MWYLLDNILFCAKITVIKEIKDMSKFCVFCGKPPVDKNREHIIPQWLIKYTERGKMPVVKVMEPDGTLKPKISYMNFTMPACEACNEEFSQLEGLVKPILLNILAGKPVSAREISLFLDWMDKVRLGLRLSMVYLQNGLNQEPPHTFIKQRTGYADRMLIIEKIKPQPDVRLAFPDTHTRFFKTAAQSFQFIIDNYVFTNASAPFIVSSKLGFPYATHMETLDAPNVLVDNWMPGTERTRGPVFGNVFPAQDKMIVYQPIFKPFTEISYYDTDYVKSHSLDYDAGLGGIFYQRGKTNEIKYLEPDDKIALNPQETKRDFKTILRGAYEIQSQVLARAPKYNTSDARFNEYNNNLMKVDAMELKMAIAAHR